jgi:hypothetical protein
VAGTVKFTKARVLKFNGNKERATIIHIDRFRSMCYPKSQLWVWR